MSHPQLLLLHHSPCFVDSLSLPPSPLQPTVPSFISHSTDSFDTQANLGIISFVPLCSTCLSFLISNIMLGFPGSPTHCKHYLCKAQWACGSGWGAIRSGFQWKSIGPHDPGVHMIHQKMDESLACLGYDLLHFPQGGGLD
jgi:hypothetical protein